MKLDIFQIEEFNDQWGGTLCRSSNTGEILQVKAIASQTQFVASLVKSGKQVDQTFLIDELDHLDLEHGFYELRENPFYFYRKTPQGRKRGVCSANAVLSQVVGFDRNETNFTGNYISLNYINEINEWRKKLVEKGIPTASLSNEVSEVIKQNRVGLVMDNDYVLARYPFKKISSRKNVGVFSRTGLVCGLSVDGVLSVNPRNHHLVDGVVSSICNRFNVEPSEIKFNA